MHSTRGRTYYINHIPYLLSFLIIRKLFSAQLVDQLCVEFEREVNQMSKDLGPLGPLGPGTHRDSPFV